MAYTGGTHTARPGGRGRAANIGNNPVGQGRGIGGQPHMHLNPAMAGMYTAAQPVFLQQSLPAGSMQYNSTHPTAALQHYPPQLFYMNAAQAGQNGNANVYYQQQSMAQNAQLAAQSQPQTGGRPPSNPGIGGAIQQPGIPPMQNMYQAHQQIQPQPAANPFTQQMGAAGPRMNQQMPILAQGGNYQQQPPPIQKPAPRKKFAIAIVDPNTKAVVNEEQLNSQGGASVSNHSTPTSSNRSTPVPQHHTAELSLPHNIQTAQTQEIEAAQSPHDVKDQFKAKVAASLSNSTVSTSSESTPPTLPSSMQNGSVAPTTPISSHTEEASLMVEPQGNVVAADIAATHSSESITLVSETTGDISSPTVVSEPEVSTTEDVAAVQQTQSEPAPHTDVPGLSSGDDTKDIPDAANEVAYAGQQQPENTDAIVSSKVTDTTKDTVSVVEETGSVIEETGSVVEETGSDVEKPVSVVEQTGSVVEKPVSVVEQTGSVIEKTGSVVEETGSVVEEPLSDRQELTKTDDVVPEEETKEAAPNLTSEKSDENVKDNKPVEESEAVIESIDKRVAVETATEIPQSSDEQATIDSQNSAPSPAQEELKSSPSDSELMPPPASPPPATSSTPPPPPSTTTVSSSNTPSTDTPSPSATENKENTPSKQPSAMKGSKSMAADLSKLTKAYDVKKDDTDDKMKKYTREFLMSLQKAELSQVKPDGLGAPILQEIISTGKGVQVIPFGRRDFNPDYFNKSLPSPRGSMSKRSMSRDGGKVMGGSSSVTRAQPTIAYKREEVNLRTVANAWKPGDKAPDNIPEDEKAHQDLLKQFRGMLNKITPSTFKKLLAKILELPVRTEKNLEEVMMLVFDKARNEPDFSKIYATLCQAIAKEYKVKKENGEEVNFRKILLVRCQKEFETMNKDDDMMIQKMEELGNGLEKAQSDEERARLNAEFTGFQVKARHRKLGYMRFLGELFLLHMLTPQIMNECVICLLKAHDEENLEYLCRLWTTIGRQMDSNDKARVYNDQIFTQMRKIASGQSRNVTVRIKFALQDVIELRENNWVPRRDKSVPKTLKEIHAQMAMEAHEKQVMIDKNLPSRNSQGRAPPMSNRNRRDEQEGWSHVKTGSQRVDPTKLKLTSQKVGGGELQLGPQKGFGGWGRGSSGSGKNTPPQQEEKSSAPANRFSALQQESDRNRMPMNRSGGSGQSRGGSNRMGTPRGSAEKERTRAVEMVRQISRGSRGPSRESSVEGRTMRTPTPTRPAQVSRSSAQSAPAVKQMSREELVTKIKSIIDEYLHNNDIQEVLEIAREELVSQTNKELITECSINHVLERSQQARKGTGVMLSELLKYKLLPLEAHTKGLGAVLEFADDLAIDIPNVWQYFGELIAPMFTAVPVPLAHLEQVCSPLVGIGKAAVLAAAVLEEASHKIGHVELGKRWIDSNLSWSTFLSEGEDEQAFIKAMKLEYTIATTEAAPSQAQLSTSDIAAQLDKLLIEDSVANETVFDWVDSRLPVDVRQHPSFIRSLTTSVVQSCIDNNDALQESKFKDRAPLLYKYYDNKPERELAALSAFEDQMTKLEHPADLFSEFCYIISDLELIADDSFYHWEKTSKNGIAVKSVGKFLAWLKEDENK